MARIIVPISSLGNAGSALALRAEVDRVAKELQIAVDEYYRINYPTATYLRILADKVTVKPKKKYINIDIGSSGAYMVDTTDGTVYGIKGYGVPHRGLVHGNIADLDGKTLLRQRFARSGTVKPAKPRTAGSPFETGGLRDTHHEVLTKHGFQYKEQRQHDVHVYDDGRGLEAHRQGGMTRIVDKMDPKGNASRWTNDPGALDAYLTQIGGLHDQRRVTGGMATGTKLVEGSEGGMIEVCAGCGNAALGDNGQCDVCDLKLVSAMTQDEQNDADYKSGWQAGLKMLHDREAAYRWEREVYAKEVRPSWFDMGQADVIAEHRVARFL
jgi:hypothetical protein